MFQSTRDNVRKFIFWLMMLNDTPHSIAMGVAVGFFVAMTPTLGMQMLIVAFLSMFIRCNRTAGCATVWLTNPLTALPVYFANYLAGTWLLRMKPVSWELFVQEFQGTLIYSHWYQDLFAVFRAVGRLSLDLAGPLWFGSVVLGLAGAGALYVIVRKVVIAHRRAHQRHLEAALVRESAPPNEQGEPSNGRAAQDR